MNANNFAPDIKTQVSLVDIINQTNNLQAS